MKHRARVLFEPHLDPAVATGARDAMALWVAGVLWLVVCGVVARLDLTELMPAALGGALVLAISGRFLLSLGWFPVATALAILVDPLLAQSGARRGSLAHLDLVVLAVLTLTVSRVITGGAGRIPRILRQPSLHLILGALIVAIAAASTAHNGIAEARAVARGLTAFAVGAVIFARAPRASRLWSAAAVVASAIIVAAAIALTVHGIPGLAVLAVAAERGWQAPRALMHTLLFVAPVTMGFALDRSRPVERGGLLAVGIAALATAEAFVIARGGTWPVFAPNFDPIHLALPYALLAVAVTGAIVVSAARPRERGCWTGLALGFSSLLIADVPSASLSAVPVLLLSAAALGAVSTALDREDLSMAEDDVPVAEAA